MKSPATSVLALLAVESTDLVADIRRAFERHGATLEARHVARSSEIEAALRKDGWDLVLAEASSEEATLSAIDAFCRRGLEIPVIALTRGIDDPGEPPIRKAGACDAVPKDALDRLVTASFRELAGASGRRERQRAQDEIKQSEIRFQALVERSSDAIAMLDAEGHFLYASDSHRQLLGYAPEELIGTDGFRLIHPDDLERVRTLFAAVIAEPGRTETLEFRVRHRDGTTREVEATGKNRFEEPGISAFVANYRDITARKKAERELQLFEYAMKSVSEIAGITDLEDRWIFVNDAFLATYEYTRDEILGQPASVVWSPNNPAALGEKILRDTRRGGWRGELLNVSKSGREFPVELSTSQVRDAEGRLVGLLGIARDVSERREAQRVQSALYRIAEASSSVDDIDDFYAAVHGIVSELMDARNFYIALRDPRTRDLVFPYFVDEKESSPPSISAGGLTEYVLRSGEPLLASPQAFKDLIADGVVTPRGAPSIDWLGVPLRTEAGVFGALVVQSYSPTRRFQERDRDVLVFVSRNIASALDRRRSAEALRDAHEFRERVLESATNAIFALDRRGRFTLANRRASEITGYSADELSGKRADFLVPPGRVDEIRAQFRKTARHGIPVSLFETELLRRDGDTVPITFSIAPLFKGRRVIGVAGTAEDITERKRAQGRIEHLAYHDALTGLPNHVLLKDRLQVAISRAQHDRRSVAVLFLDLDRFKFVNDSLGHATGDRLLQRVGERLASMVRQGDTVARLGGDEFVVVLSDLKQVEDAVRLAEKIVASIRLPFRIESEELFVTTSVGISAYPADGDSGEILIKNADTAMYRAKDQGRDHYQLFTPTLSARSANRLTVETGLRRAMENGSLVLHYQPIYDLATAEIVAVEALLRWNHAERGMVMPSEFVPLAEESGLIVPIGTWVLQTACAQATAWKKAGLRPPRLAVNFSPRQLQVATLPGDVGRILHANAFDPQDLEIEITETVAMTDAPDTLTILYALKHLGARISMDDFGTGYSSLGVLKRLPVDTLKLDRSFLRDIETSPDDAAISRAIIVLAHGMKLTVTAEGVENEHQLAFLRRHRCDTAQGFLFSRPVPAHELEILLRRRLDAKAGAKPILSPSEDDPER